MSYVLCGIENKKKVIRFQIFMIYQAKVLHKNRETTMGTTVKYIYLRVNIGTTIFPFFFFVTKSC